jgi:hypothetical protein
MDMLLLSFEFKGDGIEDDMELLVDEDEFMDDLVVVVVVVVVVLVGC